MQHYVAALLLWSLSIATSAATDTRKASLASKLVPGPVEYAVLGPAGFAEMQDLPLVLNLHGGGGSRKNLLQQRKLWDAAWTRGDIPPLLFVTPSVTKRGFYMNFKDGSERWEDFITGPFIAHLRNTLPVSQDPERTFLMGISMGGMGALRMALRAPENYGAVAALEPGIEPVIRWEDIRPKHRFWRDEALFETAFGSPVDAEYWAANNPATMVTHNADKIRASNLQIYLDAADLDEFWLYEGAEFLHQTLWQHKIRHEYHLVRGARHVGPSLLERQLEAVRFLVRSYQPWSKPRPGVRAIMQVIERQKRGLKEVDHYNEGVVQPQ